MARITMKFGGTSVGSAEAISQAANIVRAAYNDDHQVLVVSSAMGGVTDLLIEGARTAAAGDAARYQVIGGQLREKHETAIRTLITSDV